MKDRTIEWLTVLLQQRRSKTHLLNLSPRDPAFEKGTVLDGGHPNCVRKIRWHYTNALKLIQNSENCSGRVVEVSHSVNSVEFPPWMTYLSTLPGFWSSYAFQQVYSSFSMNIWEKSLSIYSFISPVRVTLNVLVMFAFPVVFFSCCVCSVDASLLLFFTKVLKTLTLNLDF